MIVKQLVNEDSAKAREFVAKVALVGIDASFFIKKAGGAAHVHTAPHPAIDNTAHKPYVLLNFLNSKNKT